MELNHKIFYDAIRVDLGTLTTANVAGFELVLAAAQARDTSLPELAYINATAWWESGKTMQPVKEAYWLSEAWRKKNLRYFPYYGRGLVQLTWLENYKLVSEFYGVDFVKNPDLVLDPTHSVNILFDGMHKGWFTGKKLTDFIDDIDESDDDDLKEYIAARKIVNGTDRQLEIGKLAIGFERALRKSVVNTAPIFTPPAAVDGGPSLELLGMIADIRVLLDKMEAAV